jgi:hypothetical protein
MDLRSWHTKSTDQDRTPSEALRRILGQTKPLHRENTNGQDYSTHVTMFNHAGAFSSGSLSFKPRDLPIDRETRRCPFLSVNDFSRMAPQGWSFQI